MILNVQKLSRLMRVQAARKLILRVGNKLKLNKSKFSVSSIHFRKNNIVLDKNTNLSCGRDSFLQHSMIYVEGKDNQIILDSGAELYNVKIRIFGNGNRIKIGDKSILHDSAIMVRGNQNHIMVGKNFSSYNTTFHLEDDRNEVRIGDGTTCHGRDYKAVNFELCEGSKIIIGEDCMLSNDIQIRPSDAHSLVDLNGKRLNPAEDIIIGDHCWICLGVTILKGTQIREHTVVGAGAVWTKKYTESYCVLAGNPAKVVKRSIDWNRKFL